MTCCNSTRPSSLKRYHSEWVPTWDILQLSTDPSILTLVDPFCRALGCSKRCGKKTHSTRGYLVLNIHPSSRMRKSYQVSTLLSQHIVTVETSVIAPTPTTVGTTTAPSNAPPSLIHISRCMSTLCYRMSRHHCHSARCGTQPSNCALSNNKQHPNSKEHSHTYSTRDRYATR